LDSGSAALIFGDDNPAMKPWHRRKLQVSMLPDIPKTKAEISRQLRLRIRKVAGSLNPFLSMGTTVIQHEGFAHSYEQIGVGIIEEKLKEHAIPIEIKLDEVPDLIGDRLIAKVDGVADELARRTSQDAYKKLDESMAKVGNSIDAGGKPLSQEIYLEMLQKMEIDFTEDGEPAFRLMMHPDMADVVRKRMEEWENDKDFQRRYNELILLKREAWFDRESSRKLVD
jgi:hypothetical protein